MYNFLHMYINVKKIYIYIYIKNVIIFFFFIIRIIINYYYYDMN